MSKLEYKFTNDVLFKMLFVKYPELWLTLFDAKTEADLAKLEAMEVPVMKQAIGAYRHVTATDEFREIERLRSRARHNEASALGHARRKERERWQGIVADKDATLADMDAALAGKDAALADKDTALANKDAALADKDTTLANKDAENETLRAQLAELQAQLNKAN